jgi:hypothetical protein
MTFLATHCDFNGLRLNLKITKVVASNILPNVMLPASVTPSPPVRQEDEFFVYPLV